MNNVNRYLFQNPYLRTNSLIESERGLQQDLFDELIINNGITVWYVPRKLNNVDEILGEDMLSSFDVVFPIPAYWTNNSDFDGNQAMSSYNIGLFNNYNLQLFVSQVHWQKYVDQDLYKELNKDFIERIENPYNIKWQPSEGDLIVFKTDDNNLTTPEIWEIRYANNAKLQAFMGWYGWEIYCELFTYTHEDTNTELEELEKLSAEFSHDLLDISRENEMGHTSDAYGDREIFKEKSEEILIPKNKNNLDKILRGYK